jgi:hypothetical protein
LLDVALRAKLTFILLFERFSHYVLHYSFELNGWTLNHALAISADGTVIVGNGTNPAGSREAWIAVIPEPGTFVLTAIGLALISCVAAKGRVLRRDLL